MHGVEALERGKGLTRIWIGAGIGDGEISAMKAEQVTDAEVSSTTKHESLDRKKCLLSGADNLKEVEQVRLYALEVTLSNPYLPPRIRPNVR